MTAGAPVPQRVLTEVCVDGIAGVRLAAAAGADRVEVCSALEVGGLTPSAALIEQAVATARGSGLRVHVLIRPRPGDYRYSVDEIRCMERDVAVAAAAGVHGVVIGALRQDRTVDLDVVTALVSTARAAGRAARAESPSRERLAVTFHRAFDDVPDPLAALAELRVRGIDRVLTSGGAPTAQQGAAVLAALVRAGRGAGEPISVLAAGGVRSGNVAALIAATGVGEVHFSARRTDVAQAANDGGPPRVLTDPDEVRATVGAVRAVRR